MLTTGQIAQDLSATLIGSAAVTITRLDALDTADEGTLSFIRSEKFFSAWVNGRAGAAFIAGKLIKNGQLPAELEFDQSTRALLVVPEPDLALTSVAEKLAPPRRGPAAGVHASAVVHPSAKIDPSATVGPLCTVGEGSSVGAGSVLVSHVSVGANVTIGPGCVLHPHAAVYDGCVLGANVTLHASVTIGADGFGYRPGERGLVKLPHHGNVVLGDSVEIGANSCIDRARFGSTVIGEGTKIDNLVQIGHNGRIGKHCVICGCTGLAGSVTVGDGVQIGGGVGIGDNLTIGRGARIAGRASVMNDVAEGVTVAGYPAMPGKDYLRILGAMKKAAGLS